MEAKHPLKETRERSKRSQIKKVLSRFPAPRGGSVIFVSKTVVTASNYVVYFRHKLPFVCRLCRSDPVTAIFIHLKDYNFILLFPSHKIFDLCVVAPN